jgi:hypothetical protein
MARTEVFISYSHKDKKYLDELMVYLDSLSHDKIKVWCDTDINTGDVWLREITEHMSKARVAILMVSQPFLVSRFIRNKELPELLSAAEKEQAKIMWIPVSVSTVKTTEIEIKNGEKICITKYQAVSRAC